jgi:hypothetical protein
LVCLLKVPGPSTGEACALPARCPILEKLSRICSKLRARLRGDMLLFSLCGFRF